MLFSNDSEVDLELTFRIPLQSLPILDEDTVLLSFPLFHNTTNVRIGVSSTSDLSLRVEIDKNSKSVPFRSSYFTHNFTKIINTNPMDNLGLKVLKKATMTQSSSGEVMVNVLVSYRFPVIFIEEFSHEIPALNSTTFATNKYGRILFWAFDVYDSYGIPSVQIIQNGTVLHHEKHSEKDRFRIPRSSSEEGVRTEVVLHNPKKSDLLVRGRLLTSNFDSFYVDASFTPLLQASDNKAAAAAAARWTVFNDVFDITWKYAANASFEFSIVKIVPPLPAEKRIVHYALQNASGVTHTTTYYDYFIVLKNLHAGHQRDKSTTVVDLTLKMYIHAFQGPPVWNPLMSIIVALVTTSAAVLIIAMLSVFICIFSPKARPKKKKKGYQQIQSDGDIHEKRT